MKKLFALFFFFALHFSLSGQTITPDVLASGGGFYVGSNFTNSFTVGQGSLPQTFTGSNFILTQGFQQPVDFPTAVAELYHAQNIGTYPNPSSGTFDLQYDLNADATVNIEVYDVVGRVVYSETSDRNAGHQTQEIALTDQPNGVYFVRCTINTNGNLNTFTQKITISR